MLGLVVIGGPTVGLGPVRRMVPGSDQEASRTMIHPVGVPQLVSKIMVPGR